MMTRQAYEMAVAIRIYYATPEAAAYAECGVPPRGGEWIPARTLAAWMKEQAGTVEGDASLRAEAGELYRVFRRWWAGRNPDCDHPPAQRLFGAALGSVFDRRRSGATTYYHGISLRKDLT